MDNRDDDNENGLFVCLIVDLFVYWSVTRLFLLLLLIVQKKVEVLGLLLYRD